MTDMRLVEGYFLEAETALGAGNFQLAKTTLEDLLAIEPGYGPAHHHMGWIYACKFDDYKRAEYHYRLALKYAPEYASTYLNFSYLLFDMREYDRHLSTAQRGLEIPGTPIAALTNELGRNAEMSGNWKLAAGLYKLAKAKCLNDEECKVCDANYARTIGKMSLFERVVFWFQRA